jgi:hypothetical protein
MGTDIAVTAQGVVNQREATAAMFWQDYELVSHDAAAGVAVIKKAATGTEYTVCLSTGGCTCPDSLCRCAALNARLIAKGLPGGVECKHSGIARRLVNQLRALLLADAQRQARPQMTAGRVSISDKERTALWGN